MNIAARAIAATKSLSPVSGVNGTLERPQNGADGSAERSAGLLPPPASDLDGFAVMLIPQDDDAADIAPFCAVDPSDLHTTLVYYGDAAQYKGQWTGDLLAKVLQAVALVQEPIQAVLGGVIRFSGKPGGNDPIVFSVDSKDLSVFRQAVLDRLADECSITEQTEHGFTPHMTMGYLPHDESLQLNGWKPRKIVFDRVRVGFGKDQYDVYLGEGWGDKSVRHVSSAAGVRRYNLPIGSVIGSDGPQVLPLDIEEPDPKLNKPRDMARISKRPDVADARTEYSHMQAQFETLQERDDEYWSSTDKNSYTDSPSAKFYRDYGFTHEDTQYNDSGLAGAVAQGPWAGFGACKAIRQSAYDMLGFKSTNQSETRGDAHIHTAAPSWGAGAGVNNPALHAYALMMGVRDGDRFHQPLYRGVTVPDSAGFVKKLKEGDTFDMPLVSFANDRGTSARFGTDVTFVLQSGARAVEGGVMGLPTDDPRHHDWVNGMLEDDDFREYVSGGRFRITGIRPNSNGYTVLIKQIGVFDPQTAVLTKTDGAGKYVQPNFSWMFDTALALPKPKKKQAGNQEKAALLVCKDCGKTYAADSQEEIDAHRALHDDKQEHKDVYNGMPGLPMKRKPKRPKIVQRTPSALRTRASTHVARNITSEKKDGALDLVARALAVELKTVRHVATQAGAKRFGQPIGTIIVADGKTPLPNLSISKKPAYDGWTNIDGTDGKTYEVGHDDSTDSWVACGPGGWDDVVVDRAKSEDDALRKLDAYVKKQPQKKTPLKPKTTVAKSSTGNKKPVGTAKARAAAGTGYKRVGKGLDVQGENNNIPYGNAPAEERKRRIPPGTRTLRKYTDKSPEAAAFRKKYGIPPAYKTFWINESRDESAPDSQYDGLVFIGYDEFKKKDQFVFSSRHWDRQDGKKFGTSNDPDAAELSNVPVLLKNRTRVLNVLKKDAQSSDPKKRAAARALLVQAMTGMRIGAEHKKGERAIDRRYGASTLEARHVTVNKNSVTFNFMAKGNHPRFDDAGQPILNPNGKNIWPGKPYKVRITDKTLVDLMTDELDSKARNDRLFQASASQANDYFRDVQKQLKLSGDLTSHNFRHVKATMVALSEIDKMTKPKTEADFIKKQREVCERVGAVINDSWDVARRSYIMHSVWQAWTNGTDWKAL